MTVFWGLLYGLFRGLCHALEPDHVVAVSTMISDQRSMRTRVAYAASWGAGHAAMLVAVGIVLMLLRAKLPARVDAAFEVIVSLMLIALGLRALRHAFRRAHSEDAHEHREWKAVGPLAIGMVHGLAGSGALTALVVAKLQSPIAALAFMVLFGAGAAFGMLLLAGAAGFPLARILQTRWGMPALLGATGALSLVLGLTTIAPAAMRCF